MKTPCTAQVLDAAEDARDLDLLGRLMLRTSARNQLHGTVTAIHRQGHNDLIDLELPGGLTLQAQITHVSTQRLELATGMTLRRGVDFQPHLRKIKESLNASRYPVGDEFN